MCLNTGARQVVLMNRMSRRSRDNDSMRGDAGVGLLSECVLCCRSAERRRAEEGGKRIVIGGT